jgi:hypothetical protein
LLLLLLLLLGTPALCRLPSASASSTILIGVPSVSGAIAVLLLLLPPPPLVL